MEKTQPSKKKTSQGREKIKTSVKNAGKIKKNPRRQNIGIESFLALADNLLDVIMVFDRHYRHLYVNSYVEKQTGIPHLNFIGKTHQELGFPDHLCRLWETSIEKVFKSKEVHRMEFELPNGIWIDWLLMPEKDKKGNVRHVITAAREITERKRMEEELEQRVAQRTRELMQSEEKYRSLFEDSKDMVYISTVDGRFIDINSAGVNLLGFSSKEEALNSNVRDRYLNPTDREKFKKMIRRDGFVKDFDVTLIRTDGQPIQVLITATAIRDKKGKFTASRGIIRDITERRKLEQQIFHIQKMESIGTMAGGIAHDFNNILCGIMGYASLMKAKISPDHPFFNYVDTIERSTQRAGELTSKLLSFATDQAYHITPVNINDIIQETIKIVSSLFDRSVEVKTCLDESLPTVEADSPLIHQVVMNLLVNARDAMPRGGMITIETKVENLGKEDLHKNIEARQGHYVVISVADTGIGIAEDNIQRIFDPFFSTKEKGKGTGLGLAVVYGVVKNHGGFVMVDSQPGKGSIFYIYLPVSGKPLEQKIKFDVKLDLHGHENILVIDDEDDILSLAKNTFETYGYNVLLASNGQEACKIFEKNHSTIDLVLLDIVMPKMSGLETYQKLTAINPQVKVIISSGYSKNEYVYEIFKLGEVGFIQKPFQIKELLRMVRSILDKDIE